MLFEQCHVNVRAQTQCGPDEDVRYHIQRTYCLCGYTEEMRQTVSVMYCKHTDEVVSLALYSVNSGPRRSADV